MVFLFFEKVLLRSLFDYGGGERERIVGGGCLCT